jgi:hypothetical protein
MRLPGLLGWLPMLFQAIWEVHSAKNLIFGFHAGLVVVLVSLLEQSELYSLLFLNLNSGVEGLHSIFMCVNRQYLGE